MNQVPALVLLIEDEPQMRKFLETAITSHGYRYAEASTAREGLAQAASRNPDVVLLDLGLPDEDGIEVTRRLREWSGTPIIVISARGQEQDKIAALDAGADDYLTKPFAVGELLARLRVALRHLTLSSERGGDTVYQAGGLRIHLEGRRVTVEGNEVHLTPIQFKLLATLVKHPGKVLTHRFLLKEVWGPNSSEHTHYLRVYMTQLRHKLEADPARPQLLRTELGIGYRFTPE